MQSNKTSSIILLLVGVGLLGASLLADVIGIGDNPGFGLQQTAGTAGGSGHRRSRPVPDTQGLPERRIDPSSYHSAAAFSFFSRSSSVCIWIICMAAAVEL